MIIYSTTRVNDIILYSIYAKNFSGQGWKTILAEWDNGSWDLMQHGHSYSSVEWANEIKI
jgi:hypothetical protein